jgi:drug/metabolite transporter (DMT)-like permease
MSSSTGTESAHKAGAFDIRTFIALLIGIYGIVLVAMGLFSTSEEDLAKADDLNINLWAGIGMVVVAGLFQAWAMWRPVVVPDDPEES